MPVPVGTGTSLFLTVCILAPIGTDSVPLWYKNKDDNIKTVYNFYETIGFCIY